MPRCEKENHGVKTQALLRLRPVLQYIDQHFAEDLNVETLADMVFVHPATLREWFSAATGKNPLHYIHHVRISAACALLRGSDLSIASIAMSVGYHSLSGFNRQFSAIIGQPPSVYQKG